MKKLFTFLLALAVFIAPFSVSLAEAKTTSKTTYIVSEKPLLFAENTYIPKKTQKYQSGPKGGCYYWNKNGKKTYVKRSLCY